MIFVEEMPVAMVVVNNPGYKMNSLDDGQDGGEGDGNYVSLYKLGQSRPMAGKAQTGSPGQSTVLWCSQCEKNNLEP